MRQARTWLDFTGGLSKEIVLDAVRAYSDTAHADGSASRKRQTREADEAIERATEPR